VLSGDGWSDLARSLFARDETDETGVRKTDSSVAFFFVSYMLINSIMLLNVVVAVLLVPCVCVCVCVCVFTYVHTHTHPHPHTQDEFVSSVTDEKEAEEQGIRAEQDKRKLRHIFSNVLRIVALYIMYVYVCAYMCVCVYICTQLITRA
jgi:small-conductance mechanosensitive channel